MYTLFIQEMLPGLRVWGTQAWKGKKLSMGAIWGQVCREWLPSDPVGELWSINHPAWKEPGFHAPESISHWLRGVPREHKCQGTPCGQAGPSSPSEGRSLIGSRGRTERSGWAADAGCWKRKNTQALFVALTPLQHTYTHDHYRAVQDDLGGTPTSPKAQTHSETLVLMRMYLTMSHPAPQEESNWMN